MTSGKVVTTVGYEKRYNPSLQFDDQARFVEFMTVGQPARPANMLEIVAVNQGQRPYSWQETSPPELPVDEALRRLEEGHFLLDTRAYPDFAVGHIPGSVNVQLSSPQFEQRVGWILPPHCRVLLVVEEVELVREVVHRLAFVGLDQRVEGVVDLGGWRAQGRPESFVTQIDVRQLSERLASERIAVLDVRDDTEWAAGHIAGARHRPMHLLPQGIQDLELDPAQPVAVVCAGGLRSSTACSLLAREGFGGLLNVIGGMTAWGRARLELQLP